MSFSLQFGYAHDLPSVLARVKSQPSDFMVVEQSIAATSHGEHVYLRLRKTNMNTAWLAKCIAETANVTVKDVGYAVQFDSIENNTMSKTLLGVKLYEEDGMVDLSMADVAGGGIVVGSALAGRRPIYVIRYIKKNRSIPAAILFNLDTWLCRISGVLIQVQLTTRRTRPDPHVHPIAQDH